MAVGPQILSILGPTAGGKSELAMAIADRAGADILSVDSMQVYRGMDVGTAKPSTAEQKSARHHLIDVVDPTESFTVARFLEIADEVIATSTVPLIVVGGTPLYYKALFEGMFEGPAADEGLRDELRQKPNEELHQRLSEVDPAAATRIHANDTKRLIRALEVHQLTGKPISELQREWDSPVHRHPATWVGLRWEKEALNRRINARVKAMMAGGWVEETRGLLQKYGTLSMTASGATGYAELIAHAQGRMSLDEATEQIKIATRQLARRQMKWFKRFPHVHWLPGEAPLDEKVGQVLKLWPK